MIIKELVFSNPNPFISCLIQSPTGHNSFKQSEEFISLSSICFNDSSRTQQTETEVKLEFNSTFIQTLHSKMTMPDLQWYP